MTLLHFKHTINVRMIPLYLDFFSNSLFLAFFSTSLLGFFCGFFIHPAIKINTKKKESSRFFTLISSIVLIFIIPYLAFLTYIGGKEQGYTFIAFLFFGIISYQTKEIFKKKQWKISTFHKIGFLSLFFNILTSILLSFSIITHPGSTGPGNIRLSRSEYHDIQLLTLLFFLVFINSFSFSQKKIGLKLLTLFLSVLFIKLLHAGQCYMVC